jgi:hypothetical protein
MTPCQVCGAEPADVEAHEAFHARCDVMRYRTGHDERPVSSQDRRERHEGDED